MAQPSGYPVSVRGELTEPLAQGAAIKKSKEGLTW